MLRWKKESIEESTLGSFNLVFLLVSLENTLSRNLLKNH